MLCKECIYKKMCYRKIMAEGKEIKRCKDKEYETRVLITCDSKICHYCARDTREELCIYCKNYDSFLGKECYETE